ncbi:MAG: Bro-N domain-containing protein [Burkholderiaceae bacterium]|nr:Bro-N domain-containing protein [Burkholderiaceae bacterium]
MIAIIPFQFEQQVVRIHLDAAGEPWFVATDICAALTITTEQTRRLDEDEKGLRTVQTPGGRQEMVCISESGLYSLILTSRKPEAKRFKRWVTHEVLPSIRKTGAYAAAAPAAALPAAMQDTVGALLLIGDAIARVPGVKHGIAMVATLTVIHENTGLALDSLRRALPPANEPLCCLNPTQLGERVGMPARAINSRLQALGLQFKNDRDEWELTTAGQRWAEALPFSRNGHSGYQVLWNPAATTLIREVA